MMMVTVSRVTDRFRNTDSAVTVLAGSFKFQGCVNYTVFAQFASYFFFYIGDSGVCNNVDFRTVSLTVEASYVNVMHILYAVNF